MAEMAEEHKALKENKDVSQKIFTKNKKLSSSNHVIRKRQPCGVIKKTKTDIYITKKTPFKAQLHKCQELFDKRETEIILHSIGGSINRACEIALRLKEIHCGNLELDIKTSTLHLIDDLEPLTDEADYEVNTRNNSGVHIRIYRKVPIENK